MNMPAHLGAPRLPSTGAGDAPGVARAHAFLGGSDRPDANGRDLVATFAQNLKAVAGESEGLARLGDGLLFVQQGNGYCGVLTVRHLPVRRAVELPYVPRAVDVHRAIGLHADGHVMVVVLIGDLTDDLLQHVLYRYQALHLAVLV